MKAGDYVRTNDGLIGKLQIKKEYIAIANWSGDYELEETTTYIINNDRININEIIKSSPNIIDLIEVGDYVNGIHITEKYIDVFQEVVVKRECDDDYYSIAFKNRDIETVVTKEQFKQMEYRVED